MDSFLKSDAAHDILVSTTPLMELNVEDTIRFLTAIHQAHFLEDETFWMSKAKYFNIQHEFKSFLNFVEKCGNPFTSSLSLAFTKVCQWYVIDEFSLAYMDCNRFMYLLNLRREPKEMFDKYFKHAKSWLIGEGSSFMDYNQFLAFMEFYIKLASKSEVEELFLLEINFGRSNYALVNILENAGYLSIVSKIEVQPNFIERKLDEDEDDILVEKLTNKISKGLLLEAIEEIKLIDDFIYFDILITESLINFSPIEDIQRLVSLAEEQGYYQSRKECNKPRIKSTLGGHLGKIDPDDGEEFNEHFIMHSMLNPTKDFFEWFNSISEFLIELNSVDELLNSHRYYPQFLEMMAIKLNLNPDIDLIAKKMLKSSPDFNDFYNLIAGGWKINLLDVLLSMGGTSRKYAFCDEEKIKFMLRLLDKVCPEILQSSVANIMQAIRMN